MERRLVALTANNSKYNFLNNCYLRAFISRPIQKNNDILNISFIFVGDLNVHHQKQLKSLSPTHCHGFAVFDFANLFGCSQLIKDKTDKLLNYLDLLITNAPRCVGLLCFSRPHSFTFVEMGGGNWCGPVLGV